MSAAASPVPRPASRVDANAVLALVAVAQFMVVLDATVVNVALPTIKGDVGFSEQSLSWVLNAYTLIFGGFLLLGGRAADRLGRRRLFMAGIALFAGASLVCGLSQSEGMLLVARGPAGPRRRDGLAGGAVDHPHDVRRRARAQPRARRLGRDRRRGRRGRAAARRRDRRGAQLALGLLRQRADRRRRAGAGSADRPREPRRAALAGGYDVEGAVGDHARHDRARLHADQGRQLGLDLGADAGGLRRRRRADRRLRRGSSAATRIRWSRCGSSPTAASPPRTRRCSLVAAALFGVFFFCTLYLQQVLGYSALKTGVAYLPLSLTLIGASALASRLVDRFTPKPVLVDGPADRDGGLRAAHPRVGPRRLREPRAAGDDRPRDGPGDVVRADHDRGHQRRCEPATPGWPRDCSTPPSRSAARWAWRFSPRCRPAARRARCTAARRCRSR